MQGLDGLLNHSARGKAQGCCIFGRATRHKRARAPACAHALAAHQARAQRSSRPQGSRGAEKCAERTPGAQPERARMRGWERACAGLHGRKCSNRALCLELNGHPARCGLAVLSKHKAHQDHQHAIFH